MREHWVVPRGAARRLHRLHVLGAACRGRRGRETDPGFPINSKASEKSEGRSGASLRRVAQSDGLCEQELITLLKAVALKPNIARFFLWGGGPSFLNFPETKSDLGNFLLTAGTAGTHS